MYVYMCVYMYVYIYTHLHIYIYTYAARHTPRLCWECSLSAWVCVSAFGEGSPGFQVGMRCGVSGFRVEGSWVCTKPSCFTQVIKRLCGSCGAYTRASVRLCRSLFSADALHGSWSGICGSLQLMVVLSRKLLVILLCCFAPCLERFTGGLAASLLATNPSPRYTALL